MTRQPSAVISLATSNLARSLKSAVESIKFEITVLAENSPTFTTPPLAPCSKARDKFLGRTPRVRHRESPVVIKGKCIILCIGCVGKTRDAIEYAWKHADDYRALLFISAGNPEALHRNLAACT